MLWYKETAPSEEISIDELPQLYGQSESFIVDKSLEWIVYWSHESTVTFGGKWLIEAVTLRLPDWRKAECKWGETNAL